MRKWEIERKKERKKERTRKSGRSRLGNGKKAGRRIANTTGDNHLTEPLIDFTAKDIIIPRGCYGPEMMLL